MSELRLYAIINKEALTACEAVGNRGKMMAQAGHAFLHAWWDAETREPTAAVGNTIVRQNRASNYRHSQLAVKIVLAAENEAALRGYYEDIKDNQLGVGVTLVVDAARTIFNEPTVTFLGIGPITKEEAPEWLQNLKPLT